MPVALAAAIPAPIMTSVNLVAAPIELAVDPIAFPVQTPINLVTFSIQTTVDPIALAIETICEAILASWGPRLFSQVRERLPGVEFEFHAQRSPVVLDRLR